MKNTFTKLISRLLLIVCFLFTGYHGFAQYTVTTIATGEAYAALAKDQSNNIYVVRYNATNNNYEVAKFLGGDPAVSSVIYSGLSYDPGGYAYPWGIAVNAGGDVFVLNSAITNGGEIIKLTYPSYSAAVIHAGNYYSAITTDAAGNLLTLEYNSTDDTYQVVKYTAGAESNPGTVIYNGLANPADATSPWGIVTNSSNDIFFLGFMSPDGGEINKLTYPAYNKTTLATNRAFSSLAIDAGNNLYTSEALDDTTSQVVKYTDPAQTGVVLYSGLTRNTNTFPWGLAVNSNGQVFVNDAAATGSGRIVRLDPPTSLVSSITRLNTTPTTVSTVRYTVVFNRAVTGITTLAFSLTSSGSITGAAVTSVSGGGTTYTVSLNTGTGDGTLRLNVTGTGLVPTTTNVPYTSGPTYTIDRTKPAGSIVINSGAAITGNTTVTLTTNATDASSMLMRFSTDGSAYTAYEAYAASKSLSLSAGDGLKTVYVQYLDAAGNSQTYSSTITLDQTAPLTTILTGPNDPANSTNATFTFSSNEAGSTFEGRLDGGSYAGISSPATITGIAAGAHTMFVRAIDPAGNISTPATYNWTTDLTVPTVTSVGVPANGYYKEGTTLTFTVNYSEVINVDTTTGNPFLNIVLSSGTVKAPYTGGGGTAVLTFAYTIQAGDMDMDGPVLATTLQLNGGSIKDGATNNAVVTLNSIGSLAAVFVNTSIPAVSITKTDPALVNHAVTATVTFSEAVTGLTTTDFSLLNAGLSGLTTSDNITYTVIATPLADGPVRIVLPAASVVNIGGNDNSVSDTLRFTFDGTAPTITNAGIPYDSIYIDKDLIYVTIGYDENIVLDTMAGKPYLNLTIGTTIVRADLLSNNGGELTFRYIVQMGDNDYDGITADAIVLNGATMKDAAGNNAITLNGVSLSAIAYVNTVHPSVIVASITSSHVTTAYTATITFSKQVYGLQLNELVATNATLSNLQTTDNINFTVLVTPDTNGIVTLSVPVDVASYFKAGNTASNTLSRIYDITGPVVSSVTVPANGYYNQGMNLDFSVQFNENIILDTTAGKPYINVTIGSKAVRATLTDTSAQTISFRYTILAGEMDMDGITVGTLNPNGATIKDSAINNAVLTLNNTGSTSAVFVNTVHPAVILSTTAPSAVNTAFTATFTFSEAVTGFTMSDIVLVNATVSNLQTSDNISYTVLITPITDGYVDAGVPAGIALNIGNNDNSASNTVHILHDITAPVVTSVAVPANGYYKDGQNLDFSVNFNEPVRVNTNGGIPYLNVVIGSTTVRAVYNSATFTYRYTVQSGQMDADGISVGTLVLNGGTIKDTVSNNASLTLNNIAATTGVMVNTAIPSVVISTTAAARINTMFDVKIVFSEAVTGFSQADLNVTNGTAANLTTSDNITYTATITPATDGAVSVFLPAGQAENVVANVNTVSDTVNLVYDITAPLITAGQSFNTSERLPVGTLIGAVTAIETAGTLQNWTITGDDSGGAFSIDNTGRILIYDVAALNSHANSTVHLTITVSDGLNTNVGESVAITIKFVNQAPALDTIASAVMCTNTDAQTIQLTGASSVETDQTYSFSIMANQPYFDALSVSATGLVTYQLKAGTAGIATITVTIKDDGGTSNGGVDSLRRTFTVTANNLPVVSISPDKGTTISKGDVIHLTATGGDSYAWETTAGNISGEDSDILEARPMDNTTYKVTVSSATGCKNDATITVKVVEDFKVDAVNVMSPNGDGVNDKWVIRNLDSYPGNEVKIFDRTGRMVYSRRNYANEWDATMNGSPLSEGTYYYILTFEGGRTAKGYITIIRDRK